MNTFFPRVKSINSQGFEKIWYLLKKSIKLKKNVTLLTFVQEKKPGAVIDSLEKMLTNYWASNFDFLYSFLMNCNFRSVPET